MFITSAQFITSASTVQQCPPPLYPEIAFFGRSNVGKSSLINTLTQRNNLAKASNTPGKTRLINFFLINEQRQIVDLPGYGYAKANDKEKTKRLDTTQHFLRTRKNLKKLFLLIDKSIPPQTIDLEMVANLLKEGINFAIIWTKIDKGRQKEKHKTAEDFKKELQKIMAKFSKVGTPLPDFFQISNISKKGREELLRYIEKIIP